MKKILLLVCCFFIAITTQAQTPCTPGTLVGTGNSYIVPDSATGFINGCAGQMYEQIVYLKAPKDTTFTAFGINITADVDSFVVDANIVGLPANLMVESNPALLPPAPSNPKTNFERLVIPGDSLACVKISGMLDASLMPGDISLDINIRAYLSGVPILAGGPTIDTPANVDYYKITIDAPGTGVCASWPASLKNYSDFNINNLKVFPNPANDVTNISFYAAKAQGFTFQLVNLVGDIVLSQEQNVAVGENKISLETAHLPDGFYLIKINNAEASFGQRLILRH